MALRDSVHELGYSDVFLAISVVCSSQKTSESIDPVNMAHQHAFLQNYQQICHHLCSHINLPPSRPTPTLFP